MPEPTSPRIQLLSDGARHAIFCPDTVVAVSVEAQVYHAVAALQAGEDAAELAGRYAVSPDQVLAALRQVLDPAPIENDVATEAEPAPEACQSPDQRLDRLVLHVTHDCNLRCRYCYAQGGPYGGAREAMPREIALAAVDWATAAFGGVRNLQFFGGEPLLNPLLIMEVAEHLRELRDARLIAELPRLALVTNGVLGDERVRSMLRRYDIAVTISIDGPAEVHDALRGPGSFERADRFARDCLEAGDIKVDFECTWTPLHVEQGISVADLTSFFHERYGRSVLHVAPVSAAPGTELCIDAETRAAAYAEAARFSVQSLARGKRCANSFSWRVMEALRKRKPMGVYCPAGSGTLAVDATGGTYPCFMFAGDERFCIGRFSKDGEMTARDSALAADAVRSCEKACHPECAECWAAPLCSGCIGADHLATGDATCRSSCETVRAIAEAVILEAASVTD